MPVFLGILFVFGLCVGSFLNVVILRLKKTESFFSGRSHCVFCDKILSFFELVPVFSFLVLRGKCLACAKKISIQYPLVELSTGLLFALFGFVLGAPDSFLSVLAFVFLLAFASCLVVLFVYDLKNYLIDNWVAFFAFAFVLGFIVLEILTGNYELSFLASSFLSGVLAFLFFALLYFLTGGKGMGFGDAKLGFVLGFFVGFSNIFLWLLSAFVIGAIIGLSLIVAGKKNRKDIAPFAPFLIVAAVLSFLWGEGIMDFYLNAIVL